MSRAHSPAAGSAAAAGAQSRRAVTGCVLQPRGSLFARTPGAPSGMESTP